MGNRSKKVEEGGPELLTGRSQPIAAVERLLGIMAALRDPERGCPWDRKQTFATIAPYTIEEAYEVADAIERGAMDDLKDELGDLLLQVVYHARMAEEEGAFAFPDVAEAISTKMIRRHPHVFGDGSGDGGAHQWEAIKKQEREAKEAENGPAPRGLRFSGTSRLAFPRSPRARNSSGAQRAWASIGPRSNRS